MLHQRVKVISHLHFWVNKWGGGSEPFLFIGKIGQSTLLYCHTSLNPKHAHSISSHMYWIIIMHVDQC